MTMFGIDRGALIVIIVVAAVVLINVGLLYGLLSGSTRQQIDMLRRVARRARNPWAAENEALRNLHGRVAKLGSPDRHPQDPDESDR